MVSTKTQTLPYVVLSLVLASFFCLGGLVERDRLRKIGLPECVNVPLPNNVEIFVASPNPIPLGSFQVLTEAPPCACTCGRSGAFSSSLTVSRDIESSTF